MQIIMFLFQFSIQCEWQMEKNVICQLLWLCWQITFFLTLTSLLVLHGNSGAAHCLRPWIHPIGMLSTIRITVKHRNNDTIIPNQHYCTQPKSASSMNAVGIWLRSTDVQKAGRMAQSHCGLQNETSQRSAHHRIKVHGTFIPTVSFC